MKKYAVKEARYGNKILSILIYDEDKKEFTIDIPEDVTEQEAPFMMSLFVRRGIRHIGPEWSIRWIRERIVPSSRQNIGQILRENDMQVYDEYALLVKNEGRSCQDECYLEEM